MEMEFTPTKYLQLKQPLRWHGTSTWVSKGVRSHCGGVSMLSREKSPQATSQSIDLWEMGRACMYMYVYTSFCWKEAKC